MKDKRSLNSLKNLPWAVTIVCVVFSLLYLIATSPLHPFSSAYWEGASDNYALRQSQEMLSLFLANNPGHAPRSWIELSSEFDSTNQSYNTPDFSSLQDRVAIDFATLSEAFSTGEVSGREKDQLPPIIRIKSRAERGYKIMTAEEHKVNNQLSRSIWLSLDKTNAEIADVVVPVSPGKSIREDRKASRRESEPE